ncbi:MAG: DUF1902 domain-containing protein [Rhodocyclaceae bacterium]|nr:DUF1902 domain-containing protein [Rhodocyclaceae bacterium]
MVDWDADASVWYVSDSNVPGLVAEAATLDEMGKKLDVLVPEMLEENGFHVTSRVPVLATGQ